jgi:hypothetical protein
VAYLVGMDVPDDRLVEFDRVEIIRKEISRMIADAGTMA